MISAPSKTLENNSGQATVLDALIIGAGFSGLYQLLCLRDRLGLSVQAIAQAEQLIEAAKTGANDQRIQYGSLAGIVFWGF